MEAPNLVFYVIAALILVTGGLVAFRPKPIESALWLIVNFICTSALYVLLGAHFVAVIQVLVYAGAIVVLFTFVIMLLNLNPKELGLTAAVPWTSIVLLSGTVAVVFLCLHVATPELLKPMGAISTEAAGWGSLEHFSKVFLHKYVWGFQVAGVLLLMAILAVGLLAHRKKSGGAE
jgi:NADH-quinone oxidoreductase subunit J